MNGGPTTAYRLRFYGEPDEFLKVAGEHLAVDPVVSTVVTTMALRRPSQRGSDLSAESNWWLVVLGDDNSVVGAGMRTATIAPYPPYLLPMPDEAAIALANALHQRGEEVLAVNGALPAVQLFATEMARLQGGRVAVERHTRLHELGELVPPPPVPGQLAMATDRDVELAMEWFEAFMGDADEQAGRQRGSSAHEVPDRTEMLRRIEHGSIWFWLDADGAPVHLTCAHPPALGVARIGPVFTPPAERGRGWASNAVAEVSRRTQAEGARVCLFTDQANPTSNKIYAALGYRPVVDMANLIIAT